MSAFETDEVWTSIHWLQTGEAATVRRTRAEIDNFDYGLLKSYEAIELCALNGYYPPYPSAYRCGRCAYRLICPEKAEDAPEPRAAT